MYAKFAHATSHGAMNDKMQAQEVVAASHIPRPTSRVPRPAETQLHRPTRPEPKTPKNALCGRQMPSVDISWPASGSPGHLDGREASENGQNSDDIRPVLSDESCILARRRKSYKYTFALEVFSKRVVCSATFPFVSPKIQSLSWILKPSSINVPLKNIMFV